MLQAARGVQEVHRHNVVHGGLTPHNILVNGNFDQVVVSDCGLTGSGALPYMAPEQLEQRQARAGHSYVICFPISACNCASGYPRPIDIVVDWYVCMISSKSIAHACQCRCHPTVLPTRVNKSRRLSNAASLARSTSGRWAASCCNF